MLHCSTLTTSCCAAWCPLHQVVLFDLVCMVLGCLIFSASCCRLISPASCYAAWSSLNHVMLLDLVFIMPRCLIVSTSCYAAEPSLPYVMFLGVPCLMLCCLILSSRRYAAWSFLPRATFLTFLCYVACVLYIYIDCWVIFVWSSCCYAAWPSLPLVRLLGHPYLMWCCFLYHTVLFGLALMMLRCMIPYVKLRCLTFPNWCYAASCSYIRSCYAVWSCLHDAMLLGLVYIMPCYKANEFHQHRF